MSPLEHQFSATAQAVRRPARAELVGSMVRPAELIEAARRVLPGRDALGDHPQGQGSEEWEKIDVMCRVADRVWGRA